MNTFLKSEMVKRLQVVHTVYAGFKKIKNYVESEWCKVTDYMQI